MMIFKQIIFGGHNWNTGDIHISFSTSKINWLNKCTMAMTIDIILEFRCHVIKVCCRKISFSLLRPSRHPRPVLQRNRGKFSSLKYFQIFFPNNIFILLCAFLILNILLTSGYVYEDLTYFACFPNLCLHCHVHI